jgi:neopullulanase
MLVKKLPLFVITVFVHFFCNAQINHVEPLNWWVGMKDPALQLLINGNNVAFTTPVINYSGITIKKISKADSENYLFIDLLIAKNTKPGTIVIDFKKAGKTIYTYNYTLLQREQNTAALKGFNSSDAIYLITPDRFVNGDYGNDVVQGLKENKINRGFEAARHGGDIRGIINSLDYIAAMGFTAIWPTPMLENDMPAYSYHGYAITNHYKVDPRFGTLDEYKELSAKAKQKGIKLIFDGVINHTGSNYWWMNDLPFKDWINYADSSRPTNHRRTVNEDAYASKYDAEIMKKGWFDKMMPDMNGQNPFMANYLIQNSIWWVETLQLGGIRQDTYCYSDKNFSKNWSCRIMNEYPNFSLVGEEWSLNPLITSYWQKGKQNKDGYTSCLTTIMDFPLQDALVKALTEKEANRYEDGMTKIYEALANDFVYADANNILIMADNHDMDRLYTQLNKDAALTQMALTYLLTTRGIPQVYYGTEVLMDNTGHHKNDGLIRSDFPGGWKNDTANAFTGVGLSAEQLKTQTFLKKILNWRKTAAAVYNGKTLHFAPFGKVYVYFRYTASQTLMVIMNKNESPVIVDNKRFTEILQGKTTGTEILTGENIVLKNNINVPGKTAMIIEIK